MPMFDELRRRMVSAMGVQMCSFEDLENLEVDSIDSLCLSSASSVSSVSTATDRDMESLDYDILKANAEKKVMKILKFIKKLKQLSGSSRDANMKLPVFMDLLRDKQYGHVSMSMLDTFIRTSKMIPKPMLLHYYIYFLHYACYYHHIRATTDVIDEAMKSKHQAYVTYLKLQLNYIRYIIYESRVK